MIIMLEGKRAQVDVSARTLKLRTTRSLDLGSAEEGGWGKVEIPADENLRDNTCYFAYTGTPEPRSAVVTDDRGTARFLRLAAAPDPDRFKSVCEVASVHDLTETALRGLSLLIWQGHEPDDKTAGMLEAFMDDGGVVACFPPTRAGGAPAPGTGSRGLGFRWERIETAPQDKAFRVTTWDELDGPLANADNGATLPLAGLTCARRRTVSFSGNSPPGTQPERAEASSGTWQSLAVFADNVPFLLRRGVGKGFLFVCTSLPHADWSNLGQGPVLVPAVQRMLALGGRRLTDIRMDECGTWRPSGEQEHWTCVDADGKDPRWQAGVYASGTRTIALNCPREEESADVVPADEVKSLLGEVPVQIIGESLVRKDDRLQSEIWHGFLCFSLLCCVGESFLLLADRLQRRRRTESRSE
jgi:hypothetical protein